MTQQEKYYKQLSEIYLTENELHQETSTKIMQALGITIEMHSDLIKYLISCLLYTSDAADERIV